MSQQQTDRDALVAKLRTQLRQRKFKVDVTDNFWSSLQPHDALQLLTDVVRDDAENVESSNPTLIPLILQILFLLGRFGKLPLWAESTLIVILVVVCIRSFPFFQKQRWLTQRFAGNTSPVAVLAQRVQSTSAIWALIDWGRWLQKLKKLDGVAGKEILRALRRLLPRCTTTEARALTEPQRTFLWNLARRYLNDDPAFVVAIILVLESASKIALLALADELLKTARVAEVRAVLEEVLREKK